VSKPFNPTLGFEDVETSYQSASQRIRVSSEAWVRRWLYCPNCGQEELSQAAANKPALDFFCPGCQEQFELKSKKGGFGPKVVDGAYDSLCQRLSSNSNPNFAFLSYNGNTQTVEQLFVVPKHFFVPDIIERRKPLSPTARRAGWVGCNIRLSQVPEAGKIHIVRNGHPLSKATVQELWHKTLFLREKKLEARGWLIEVMACCDALVKSEFEIEDIYEFERHLSALYPGNNNVKAKIRQQLQVLRDAGYLEFLGGGRYRLR